MLVIQAPMEQVGQAELQVRLEQRVQQELLVTQALTVLVELEVLLVEPVELAIHQALLRLKEIMEEAGEQAVQPVVVEFLLFVMIKWS
jgi:hypothetical protein